MRSAGNDGALGAGGAPVDAGGIRSEGGAPSPGGGAEGALGGGGRLNPPGNPGGPPKLGSSISIFEGSTTGPWPL